MCLRNDICPCGEKINEDDYTSKGKTDYCSTRCADKFGDSVVTQKTYSTEQNSLQWRTPIPS